MNQNEHTKRVILDIYGQLDTLIGFIQNKYSFDIFPDIMELRKKLDEKRWIDDDIEKFETAIKMLFLAIRNLKFDLINDFNIEGLDIETDTNVNVNLEDFD